VNAEASGPNLIVITGPVGSGKTTTAEALGELLDARGETVAMIDVDALRRVWPANPADPFHVRLGLANLAAIWPNLHRAGVDWLLLADVVERPEERADYQAAVPGSRVTIVRLDVPLDRIHDRLHGREQGESLNWHLHRSGELQSIMTDRGIGDQLIAVDDHRPDEVATMILERLGQAQPRRDR
jgi:adenylylsulfate kinase